MSGGTKHTTVQSTETAGVQLAIFAKKLGKHIGLERLVSVQPFLYHQVQRFVVTYDPLHLGTRGIADPIGQQRLFQPTNPKGIVPNDEIMNRAGDGIVSELALGQTGVAEDGQNGCPRGELGRYIRGRRCQGRHKCFHDVRFGGQCWSEQHGRKVVRQPRHTRQFNQSPTHQHRPGDTGRQPLHTPCQLPIECPQRCRFQPVGTTQLKHHCIRGFRGLQLARFGVHEQCGIGIATGHRNQQLPQACPFVAAVGRI